jgi:methionyl-tRNA formyltransferase
VAAPGPMKIAFAGTPEFAAVALDALLRAKHEVTLVLTRPDRPAGRGLKTQPSAVQRLARERGLPLLQPATLKDPAVLRAVTIAAPEAIVVAAYGQLVPPSLLRAAPRGAINVHASLLPRWRGAAPIQRALLAGDAVTGATIMQMDESLDTGSILLQESFAISADDTAGALHDKLAALGAQLLVRTLAEAPAPRPQKESEATYAARIVKAEAEIDWGKTAQQIDRAVRAFNPVPGAQTRLDGTAVKIWRARPERGPPAAAGTVCSAGDDGILVACGTDALRVLELQRAGGRRITAGAFLSGRKLAAGARFGSGSG